MELLLWPALIGVYARAARDVTFQVKEGWMIDRMYGKRKLRTVAAIAVSLLAATLLWGPAGSHARAVAAEPVGELQIDDLSLTAPIFENNFSVTSTSTSGGGGGGGAGKATFDPLVVQKDVDADSPALMSAVATGVHVPSVVVRVYKPGTTRTLVTYTLSDAILTGLEQTGKTEKLTISYRTIEMTAGGQSACFDLTNNVSC
jgi:type VI protein secretion system component Hcp